MYRIAFQKVEKVFFENQENAAEFRKRKILQEEQEVILNGAGINLEEYRYCLYPDNDKIHFLYLGRIMREKGIDELFEAAERLQREGIEFVLDLVGFFEDEYKNQVEHLQKEGIVRFYGFQENPKPYYAQADCVVLPSYHEGMSNVLLEAAATGRAVITTDIPGCREAVDNGKSGMLCKVRNSSSVALEYSHKYTWRLMPEIMPEKEYDMAISFLTPHYIGVHKVRAKKRIAWIHTDYSSVQVNVESELTMWDAYDYIASISNSVTKSFLKVFPSLADKILLIENILPEKLIFNQAEAFSVDSEMLPKGIKILSIGRFCKAKNFDSVPDICTRLIHFGLDVYWYIIGFGSDEQLIRRRIAECGMENRVILLGKKENPYPCIKACDLYVQPSRYEGKCVTVREAQMLGKPVVITNYETAKSQLENGVDGIIVPLDNQKCAEGILNLLKCDGLLDALVSNCRKRDYSNANEVKKVYRILENE